VQVAHGDRVTTRTTFQFKDGSLDDETTVFTQRQTFHLISDRHIQRGPSFPKPMDTLVEGNGNVTIRAGGDKDKVETNHMDLPADISNGLEFIELCNLRPADTEAKVALVAPSGKGRLVHLAIKPDGDDTVDVMGMRRKVIVYRIHIDLGGVAAVVAPVIGKQPDDIRVWVLDGPAPLVVRIEAQMYEGGPVWRIEQTAASFPGEPR
jgi:hypothetical protein